MIKRIERIIELLEWIGGLLENIRDDARERDSYPTRVEEIKRTPRY